MCVSFQIVFALLAVFVALSAARPQQVFAAPTAVVIPTASDPKLDIQDSTIEAAQELRNVAAQLR